MAGLNDLPQTPQNPADYGAGPQGPTAGPPPFEPSGPSAKEPNKDARMWAMFAHLAGFGGIVVPAVGSIIGPLVIWLLKKEQYPFVDEQGKEALNFQITMFIYVMAAFLLSFLCIGFILLPVVAILDIVFIVIATIKANDGVHYRYPKGLIFRLIK
jgi:uncharacterized Tic20 family protein